MLSQAAVNTLESVMRAGPVVPVLTIDKLDNALPIAEALLAGGINVLEITLRTPCAMAAIELLAKQLPEAFVCAGTVLNPKQLQDVSNAGAKVAISPGYTPALLEAGLTSAAVLLPGVASATEIMTAMDYGYRHFKFFPAEACGGVKALQSIIAPLAGLTFCPTGGISLQSAPAYLALPAVACVGGSWLVTPKDFDDQNWSAITARAKEAVASLV